MQAKDLMVEGPNVVAIDIGDSIYTAIRLMLKKGISGLPVVEIGPLDTRKLVGIVTEGDLLRRRETKTLRRRPRWLEFLLGPGQLADEYVRASSRKIVDVMTSPAVSVTEETSVEDIVQIMEQHHIKRVPVVRGDTLVGIITRANLLRALVREAGKMAALPASDQAIKQRLLAELKSTPMGIDSIDPGRRERWRRQAHRHDFGRKATIGDYRRRGKRARRVRDRGSYGAGRACLWDGNLKEESDELS